MKIIKESTKLLYLADTDVCMNMIEYAARTCYQSHDKKTEDSASKLVRACIKRGHESILEHMSAMFEIVTDRQIANEIVRHRHTHFSQESTRYIKYNEIGIVVPPDTVTEEMKILLAFDKAAEDTYNALLAVRGEKRIARKALPHNLATHLIMTADLREWRAFIKIRSDKAADPQVRRIAQQVHEILVARVPAIFEDIET